MTALTADRKTPARDGDLVSHPVAATTRIYAGALVALDRSGNAVPGATSTTLTAVGRAEDNIDNSAGLAGALNVTVRRGVFRYDNEATDLVARANIGANCYIVDDATVAKTNGTGTRSVAGKIVDVDSDGVWVEIL